MRTKWYDMWRTYRQLKRFGRVRNITLYAYAEGMTHALKLCQ